MPTIQVKTDLAKTKRYLSATSKKIPQAGKAALSKTVMQIKQAEQKDIDQKFTIRRGSFLRNRVKILQWPKVDNLIAKIGIDDKVKGSKLLLSQFEDSNTEKKPMQGKRVAVPITGGGARPTFASKVPTSLRFDKLKLTKVAGGKGRMVGKNGVFMAHTHNGRFVVFQRTGLDTVKPLYVLKNNVKLKRKLRFHDIASDLAHEQIPKLYNRYLNLYIKA